MFDVVLVQNMWGKPIRFTEFVRGLAKNLLATCDVENRLDLCVLENLLERCVHCGRFRIFLVEEVKNFLWGFDKEFTDGPLNEMIGTHYMT